MTLLEFGYIPRVHGLAGVVVARTHDPSSTVFETLHTVVVRPRTGPQRVVAITAVREGPRGDMLLELEGVTTRAAAEALVGATLLAERSQLPPPREGEVFVGDLIGLEAFDAGGHRLGTVESVLDTGAVPNLVLTVEGAEVMVPFVDDFVLELDLERRRVVLTVPRLEEP